MELLKQLPPQCIDMILCDLPYGVTKNPWDKCLDLNILWAHYKRIIKPCGVIALTSHGIFTGKLIMSNPEWFKYKIIWIKSRAPNFLQANRQPLKKHEDICIFYQQQPAYHPQFMEGKPYKASRKDRLIGSYGQFKPLPTNNKGKRYPWDVVFFPPDMADDWIYSKVIEHAVHPTQKPVALGRYLIRSYTLPGMVILDNACGSGSFLVAAVLEGRSFIGIEKNEGAFKGKTTRIDFIQVCRDRIAAAQREYNQQLNYGK